MQRWSERSRMLVLMLAVMLPAAALIVASVYHLRSIQREKAVRLSLRGTISRSWLSRKNVSPSALTK